MVGGEDCQQSETVTIIMLSTRAASSGPRYILERIQCVTVVEAQLSLGPPQQCTVVQSHLLTVIIHTRSLTHFVQYQASDVRYMLYLCYM